MEDQLKESEEEKNLVQAAKDELAEKIENLNKSKKEKEETLNEKSE